jgi:mannose-6-phosphate isomerase-like protein (cupin superfamily)
MAPATTRPAWYAYDDGTGTRTPWGDLVTEVVPATLTSGAFRCLDVRVSSEPAHPDYVHHHCDEAFYVISGQFSMTVGEQQLAGLDAGATVYVPRGLRRSLRSTSSTGRLLVIQTPGDEQDGVLAAPAQQPSGSAVSLAQALAAGGIELITTHQSPPTAPSDTERGNSCSSAQQRYWH